MPLKSPTLHLMCGKIASGKSTLAAELSSLEGTVLIAEDDWLSVLYPEMSSISEYAHAASKLRRTVGPHVVALLNTGVSVVLDFQANTIEARNWMREILAQTGAADQLHVLDVSDEICVARLNARNASGEHPFAPTDEQFLLLSQYFVAPSPDEGFNIVRHLID